MSITLELINPYRSSIFSRRKLL